MNEEIDTRLVDYLKDAGKILVFTGAGISTGSGIPDFRGPQGIWTKREPIYYQNFMSSEEARVTYWGQKAEDWEAYSKAKPNTVHKAVANLERADKILMVITQNIDGLHSLAGTSPERLVELHGTNASVECQSCHQRSVPSPHFAAFKKTGKSPRCHCGGYLKPATISFGQNLKEDDLLRAFSATEEADLVISLGSTLSVHPAASIPLTAAKRGIPYIIINRGATDQDDVPFVSLRLEGDVLDIFPPAVDAVIHRKN